MDNTFERIAKLLAEEVNIDESKITMDSDFRDDFDADSLDLMEIVMALGDEFGANIPDEEIDSLRTVGDVVQYIEDHADELED